MPKYNYGLIIAIPCRDGLVPSKWMNHMIQLGNNMPTGLTYKYVFLDKLPIDKARNELVKIALRNKARYILFVDDDTFIPVNAIIKMMRHERDVVTGVVWTKRDPPEPCIYKEAGMGAWFDFPQDQLVEIESAGLACCLIKTDIFHKLEEPWFQLGWTKTQKDGRKFKCGVGEDIYFYRLCKKAGIKAYADTSILCDHMDRDTGRMFPGDEIISKYESNDENLYWKLKKIKNTVVINSDGNQTLTEQCIDNLKVNTRLSNSVIVIEKTDEKKPYFGIDRLIVPEKPFTIPEMVNNVFKDTNGHYMYFVKNNVMVEEGWEFKMIELQQKEGASIVYDSDEKNIMMIPYRVLEDNGEYTEDYEKDLTIKGARIQFMKEKICKVIE